MANLTVRIGASVDRSVSVAFKNVVDAAKAAQKASAATASQGTQVAVREANKQADAQVKATEKWAKTRERIMMNSAAMAGRIAAKEVSDAERAADRAAAVAATAERRRTQALETESKKREAIERREAKAAEKKLFEGRKATANMVVGAAGGGATRAAQFGMTVAGDIARGAGVNFDLGGMVSKTVENQKLASEIANSGFMANKEGAAGIRQDPRALVADAKSAAQAVDMDTGDALRGLQEFVKKTGELETGRSVLGDMAKLAKATGSNLSDVTSAAGDVSNALGNIPDKGKVIDTIMRGIAGQGKLGAIEMSDLAKQMAKVAAAASQFGGNASDNILTMGMLAQEARGKGGAATASMAASSAMGFVNTLKTPNRIKQFRAAGVNVFDENKNLRDPKQIILESLKATGGNPEQMKKLFANVMGERAVTGYATAYRTAGGGAAGEDAVKKKFKELLEGAMMTKEEVAESVRRRQEDIDSKAQRFQNQLQNMADTLATRVIPEMEKLAPVALKVAEGFANVVSWAAENPGEAITAAIVASITKAAIGQVVQTTIERLISGAAGGSPGIGGALSKGGAVVGAFAAGGAAAEYAVDKHFEGATKEQQQVGKEDREAMNALAAYKAGKISKEELLSATGSYQSSVEGRPAGGAGGGAFQGVLGSIAAVVDPKGARDAADARYSANLTELKMQTQILKDMREALKKPSTPGPAAPNGPNVRNDYASK